DDFAVGRYNADGSLDVNFGTGGTVTTDFGGYDAAAGVALQADGKIVVTGSTGPGSYSFAVARYNADGSLDTSFGTGGKVITGSFFSYGYVSSIAAQADGKIVVAETSGGDFLLARYNANGTLDHGFDGDGVVTTDFGNNDFAN